MDLRLGKLCGLLALALLLSACASEQTPTPTQAPVDAPAAATPQPAEEATAAPEETEPPQGDSYDYGRARTGEYVYRASERYHEIDCPSLYGDVEPVYLADALEEGLTEAMCCAQLGKSSECDFPMNEGFSRTMRVTRKICLISEGGDLRQDIVFISSGDDDFDINSNFLNYTCRYFYKEFDLDPEHIKVHIRNNNREYHNMQCTRISNTTDVYYLYLGDVYEQGFTACRTCLPPTKQYYTMPVVAFDDAHYFYSSPSYIRRVMNGGVPDPSMNIDVERMLNGYYDD